MITKTVLKKVNSYLANSPIMLEPLTPNLGKEGFLVYGLAHEPILVKLPVWEVIEYKKGFGGWLIYNSETRGAVRVVRHKLMHENLGLIIKYASELQEKFINLRSETVSRKVASMLPKSKFYFQNFEDQLSFALYQAIVNRRTSLESASIRKLGADVRRELTKFLNRFPVGMASPDSKDSASVIVMRDQVVIGTPDNDDIPSLGGIPELLKDLFVQYLDESQTLSNSWGQGPFRASVGCTSKGHPGDWVTLIPPPEAVTRMTPEGETRGHKLSRPRFVTAMGVYTENPKRELREVNSTQNAWDLVRPRDITRNISTGFEHYIGSSMKNKVTEVCVLFAAIQDFNVYGQLNLDDIGLTLAGLYALQTVYSKNKVFTDEAWYGEEIQEEETSTAAMQDALFAAGLVEETEILTQTKKTKKTKGLGIRSRYEDESGKPLPGFDIKTTLTRLTSVDTVDSYEARVNVLEKGIQSQDGILKVILGSTLKAMTKSLSHDLIGIDNRGNRYQIESIVSGLSILEKKVFTLPLAALAARAQIGYIENIDQPIHEDRQPGDAYDKYDDEICRVGSKLKSQGEDPDGFIDIYAEYPNGESEYCGRALVGFLRACVMNENERSSSRTRDKEAVPSLISVRNAACQPIQFTEEIKESFEILGELYQSLTPFTG